MRQGHAPRQLRRIDRWFPHRQLLIRGPENTHAIHFGQGVQIVLVSVFAMLLLVTAGLGIDTTWHRYRAARLAKEVDRLRTSSRMEAERARDDRELLTRLSSELRERIAERDKAVTTTSDTGRSLTERQAEIDRLMAAREATIEHAIAERTRVAEERDQALAERDAALAANHELISKLGEQAAGTIAEIERIIASTGLDPARLAPVKPPAKEDLKAPRGGPFIPWLGQFSRAPDPPGLPGEAPRLVSLNAALDRLNRLRDVLAHLPLASPVAQVEVSSPFGYRHDPVNGEDSMHEGVDLRGNFGSPIFASADGVVIAAAQDSEYGRFVDIDHGYGLTTRYAHMSRTLIKQGDVVRGGQQIGAMGATGRATGVHLHYETRLNGRPRDPLPFIKADHHASEKSVAFEPAEQPRHPAD